LIAIGVCAVGIAGMIVTSALDHNGAAITFGLVTAVAILCSMVATSVAAAESRSRSAEYEGCEEALASAVEEQVQTLLRGGTDEQVVRQLVGEAVRLGRTLGRPHI